MQSKEFRIYLSLLILISIIALVDVLTIPRFPNNAWLLGYSQERLAMVVTFIIIISSLIFVFVRFWKNPAREEKALRWCTEHLQLNWLYLSILFLTLCAIYLAVGFATSGTNPDLSWDEVFIRRIWPVFFWLGGCSIATLLILLFFKRNLIKEIPYASIYTWILGGYFLSYLLFFTLTIFLNCDWIMKPVMPTPLFNVIGQDLRTYLKYSLDVTLWGDYVGMYTPFAVVFFIPFLMMSENTAYVFLTMINLLCYLVVVFAFPMIFFKHNKAQLITIPLGITGLFSYGVLFELERGQFNLIAFSFVMMSIYIYHYYPKYHVVAYVLFSIGIQLKLWPAVFVVMLIRDWGNWKRDIRGILYIGMLSFILFFILGIDTFLEFVNVLRYVIGNGYDIHWIGNHSIESFVQTKLSSMPVLRSHLGVIDVLLYGICALCLFLAIRRAYLEKEHGFNSYLFIICVVIACVVPELSNDYKLSILVGPIILGLNAVAIDFKKSKRWFPVILIGLVSFLYASLHFPYREKPSFLHNNFPVLMIIMILFTILYIKHRSNWISISEGEVV